MDYLAEIRQHTDLPVIITETGWPTENTASGVIGSEQAQVDFLLNIGEQANDLALIWVLPHDAAFGISGGIFDTSACSQTLVNQKLPMPIGRRCTRCRLGLGPDRDRVMDLSQAAVLANQRFIHFPRLGLPSRWSGQSPWLRGRKPSGLVAPPSGTRANRMQQYWSPCLPVYMYTLPVPRPRLPHLHRFPLPPSPASTCLLVYLFTLYTPPSPRLQNI